MNLKKFVKRAITTIIMLPAGIYALSGEDTLSWCLFWLFWGVVAVGGTWEMFGIAPRSYRLLAATLWATCALTLVYLRVAAPVCALWITAYAVGFDVSAYLIGNLFDRKHRYPLFPTISPRKTVVGTFGGLIVSMMCASWYWQSTNLVPDIPQLWAYILIPLGSLMALAGDLIISWVKRENDLKDSCDTYKIEIFPGHGGICDRMGSVLMVSTYLTVIHLFLHIGRS